MVAKYLCFIPPKHQPNTHTLVPRLASPTIPLNLQMKAC